MSQSAAVVPVELGRVSSWVDSFFSPPMADGRYVAKKIIKFPNITTSANDSLSFELKPLVGSNGYMIHEAMLAVSVQFDPHPGDAEFGILKGPYFTNNLLHSLFQKVEVFLNDDNVIRAGNAFKLLKSKQD
jgi:hypothetical protein